MPGRSTFPSNFVLILRQQILAMNHIRSQWSFKHMEQHSSASLDLYKHSACFYIVIRRFGDIDRIVSDNHQNLPPMVPSGLIFADSTWEDSALNFRRKKLVEIFRLHCFSAQTTWKVGIFHKIGVILHLHYLWALSQSPVNSMNEV